MQAVTLEEATNWLERYGQAWETGDAEGILDLFTENASYDETPFETNMVGHDEIRQYWLDNATNGQTDIEFGFDIWAVVDDQCLSHWTAKFRQVDDGKTVELDGAFRLVFERLPSGQIVCNALQEWWHER